MNKQDLLNNTYEQKLDISYIKNSDSKLIIDKVLIEDEKLKKRKRG